MLSSDSEMGLDGLTCWIRQTIDEEDGAGVLGWAVLERCGVKGEDSGLWSLSLHFNY